MSSFLWRLFPGVRRLERSRFLFFLLLSLQISVAQTLALVSTESMLLARLGARALPATFVAASMVTVLGSLLYAFGVQRAKNDRYFIGLCAGFAAADAVLGWQASLDRVWAFPALICLYYLAQSILINHYWTFTGDFFDTLSSKRLFPLFLIGSSLGGVLGGLALSVLHLTPLVSLVLWFVFLLTTAIQLRVARRHLRRWGPLELEEADETSMSNIQNSLHYLGQSSLARGFVLSCSAMVLAAFVSQYLYSEIFNEKFPKADDLSAFLGTLLAATNCLEIFLEGWLTPRLIQTLGVATANLLHPMLTVVAFCALAVSQGKPALLLPVAILARVNRETFDNAISAPIRTLSYNALPARFRGRVRAFLEGIVLYSAMVFAGLLLWLGQNWFSNVTLCWLGTVSGLCYLGANLHVRREYLRTLVEEMRSGRLDLTELGSAVASFEVHRLGQLWESLQSEAAEHPDPTTLKLIKTLALRGEIEPLVTGARRMNRPWLRCACLLALGTRADKGLLELAALDDSAELRLAAIQGLDAKAHPGWLDALRNDPEPQVRARALQQLLERDPGQTPIYQRELKALLKDHPLQALAVLPPVMHDELLAYCEDKDPHMRAAALGRLTVLCRLGMTPPLQANVAAQAALRDGTVTLRQAALGYLAVQLPNPECLQALASALADPSSEVRGLAVTILGETGEVGVESVRPYLASTNRLAVVAAIAALAAMQVPQAREILSTQLRERTRQLWFHLLCGHQLEKAGEVSPMLRLALEDAAQRDHRLSFELLAHLEDAKVMRGVEKVLRFSNSRARADALEVLSNLGDREASHLLVLMLDEGSLEDKLPSLPPTLERPGDSESILLRLRESPDRWLRMAAQEKAAGKRGEELMERLLVLRKVPLFGQMTLEQLEAINQLLQEVQYLPGEVIFQEGDLGDELYILVEGQIRILKGLGTDQEIELTRMVGVSYFGEMSILDDEPRSASVAVTLDSRLLVLKGERLKELIFQMPEIAFEIVKVLTQRIRTADQRLNQMAQNLQQEKGNEGRQTRIIPPSMVAAIIRESKGM